MEMTTYFCKESNEAFSDTPWSHGEAMLKSVRKSVSLNQVFQSVYKSCLLHPAFQQIKRQQVSLAALVSVHHNHWRMMYSHSLSLAISRHCHVDLGVLYAKLGFQESLLNQMLTLVADHYTAIAAHPSTTVEGAIRDNLDHLLGDFFLDARRMAVKAFRAYCLKQQESNPNSPEEALRAIALSDNHVLLAVNEQASQVAWHDISDDAFRMLAFERYQHIYLDLSELSYRDSDELELLVFDFRQYCFVKGIDLYVVGVDAIPDLDQETMASQGQGEVQFFASLEQALGANAAHWPTTLQ